MFIRFAGGVLAAALILGGYLLADRFYDTGGTYQRNSPADVDRFLQAQPVEVFRALKTGFPEAYAALTQEISNAVISGAEEAAIEAIMQEVILQVQRNHADVIYAAPDAALAAVVRISRDLHAEIREGAGRVTCNRFALEGPAALGTALAPHLASLDGQTASLLTLIAEARGNGAPPVPPATATEWQEIREVARQGSTDGEALAALETRDVTNGDLCAGLTGLLDAVLEDPAPRGHRLRASYVHTLARN